jgi:CheY-like chemotaxis protein
LILFADHSPTVQRRAEKILLDNGFVVETVSNGVAAIKKVSRLQPDLVFADVSMAGKDGYEVCDFLKTSVDFYRVPVLLVASDLEPYDRGRGERVGADGILKKPFTAHELIDVVSKFSSPEAAPETVPSEIPSPEPDPVGLEPRAEGAPASLLDAAQILPEPAAEPHLTFDPVLSEHDAEPRAGETATSPLDIPEPGAAAEPQPEPASTAPSPGAVLEAQAIPEPLPAGLEPISEPGVELQPEPVAIAPEPVAESAAQVELPSHAHGPIHQSVAEAAPELALVSAKLIQKTAELVGPLAREQQAEPGLPSPPELLAEAVPTPVETSLEAALPVPPQEPTLGTQTSPADNNADLPANPEWVHTIVRKVVTRMVPSVFPAPIIEEMVRKLTDEINAELAAPPGSSS